MRTPVLLLPAWGETRGSFDRLVPLLPAGVRAMTMDLLGHGAAGAPATGYSLVEMAEDVVGYLDAEGITSAVLLGSSSGGYVAQQVAVAHPDRVVGLVLVGSPRTLRGRPSFADEIDRLTDPVSEEWVRASFAWFPMCRPVPASYLDDRVRDGSRIPAHVWRETLNGLCAATPPTDAGTIACPTLVLRGDRDEVLTLQHQEELARAIPGSRLVVYEDTGHLVLWEQPERVARDVADFVAALP